MKEMAKTREAVVPVASVPTGLKPEPKVTVKLDEPAVRISTVRVIPAAGTVVVRVRLAVTVSRTLVFVARARARVSLARTAWTGAQLVPAGPWMPWGPWGPVSPLGPCGPASPLAPGSPFGPCGPA